MGQNSTEVAYGFGQFGSTFLKGDGAKLLLTASTAKYYVCAITMVTDVAFQATTPREHSCGCSFTNTSVGSYHIHITANAEL